MGTRADFYVGTETPTMEWLGSIAWDGYRDGIPETVWRATTEEAYREAVAALLTSRPDGRFAKDGWPWPWNTSHLTDCIYAFADGEVHESSGGRLIRVSVLDAMSEQDRDALYEEPERDWPDMSDRANVTDGGFITIGRRS